MNVVYMLGGGVNNTYIGLPAGIHGPNYYLSNGSTYVGAFFDHSSDTDKTWIPANEPNRYGPSTRRLCVSYFLLPGQITLCRRK